MALADRTPAHVKAARGALRTDVVAPAPPAAASAAPTQAEFNALRSTVDALRTALVQRGVVKAS